MRNQSLTQFHQFRTEQILDRLSEVESQIDLLLKYTDNDENKTVNNGLVILHTCLMGVLQAVRLQPSLPITGGNDD